jgi:hypothetical protein
MLDETEWDNVKIYSFMAATSLAEGWLMYYLAKRNNIDYVRSIAWNTGNMWGTIGGALTRFILLDSITDKDIGRPTIGVSIIAGGAVGVFLMNHLQQCYPRSAGDYIAINSLGIASSVFGSGLIADSKSVSTGSMYGLLFTTAGLTLGYLSTAKTSLLSSEGAIVGLGTAVAGLLGSGILLIENSKTAFFKTAWVGGLSMAGWLGTYLYLTQSGHRVAKRKADKKMNYNFGINPSGLVFMKSAPEKQYNMLRNSINMDLISFRTQF